MYFNLHCSRLLGKQLEVLRRSGKKERNVAEQCENVLSVIRSEGFCSEKIKGKRTKNGESRLESCVKYDLGHGYRLVTVRHGRNLFIPFVGSHEKTDQWLDQNRETVFTESPQGFESECIYPSGEDNSGVDDRGDAPVFPEPDLYEEYLLSKVDDKLLRAIFSGLVRQHASGPQSSS